jgi:hypothetical protein
MSNAAAKIERPTGHAEAPRSVPVFIGKVKRNFKISNFRASEPVSTGAQTEKGFLDFFGE